MSGSPRSALWLVLVCATGLAAADNLALNPGFELEDAGEPAFWQQRTPTDASRTLSWPIEAHAGERSLSIQNRQNVISRWRLGHLHELPLQPGSQVTYSAWVRTRGVLGRAHLRLYLMDTKDQILAQPDSPTLDGDHDWTELTVTQTVPNQPVYAMLYLELNGTGTAWYDDVTLTGELSDQPVGARPSRTIDAVDAWQLTGYQRETRAGKQVLWLPPGTQSGEALYYVETPTGRYDLVVNCLDEPDGASVLTVLVNGRELGRQQLAQHTEGTADQPFAWRLSGVDLQRHSKLVVRGTPDHGEYARLVSLQLVLVGAFGGELLPPEQLPPPPSLRVCESESEQRSAGAMLSSYLAAAGTRRGEQRAELLAKLTSPEQWQAYQRSLRARLPEYFGEFPEKGPLNVKITGRIEREQYTIDKLVYEGWPGYLVSADLYLPKNQPLPAPGVLFVCGHSAEGKGYHLYHECCLGLVLKGYVVLAVDPIGQGERSEYYQPDTLEDLIGLTTPQHQQVFRPSYLVGRTFVGYRVWDGLRGVDYLLTRQEVDPERLAVVGNSGGGQMALMVMAVDDRIDVCAAAHPGGPEENTWLNGQTQSDREVQSLIAPRPLRVIVGKDSGENHGPKVDYLKPFYRGLGFSDDRCQLTWVEGVHNLERPKREAAYAWLNQWLGKAEAGATEPPLEPFTAEELWASKQGKVLADLGGESSRTLNLKRAELVAPRRTAPVGAANSKAQQTALRQAVARRLGDSSLAESAPPECTVGRVSREQGYRAERLTIYPEAGIRVPLLVLTPDRPKPGAPVILHAAERGKPTRSDQPSTATDLAQAGYTTVSVDVRGVGETDPAGNLFKGTANGWDPANFRRDSLAICAWGYLGRTMAAMRVFDLRRVLDYLGTREDLKGRPVTALGEGLGSLWAMLLGGSDARVAKVVCIDPLWSYREAIGSPLYEVRGYWWVPDAVRDYELYELPALCAPKPTLWVNPRDAQLAEIDLATRPELGWVRTVSQQLGGAFEIVQTSEAPAQLLAR